MWWCWYCVFFSLNVWRRNRVYFYIEKFISFWCCWNDFYFKGMLIKWCVCLKILDFFLKVFELWLLLNYCVRFETSLTRSLLARWFVCFLFLMFLENLLLWSFIDWVCFWCCWDYLMIVDWDYFCWGLCLFGDCLSRFVIFDIVVEACYGLKMLYFVCVNFWVRVLLFWFRLFYFFYMLLFVWFGWRVW